MSRNRLLVVGVCLVFLVEKGELGLGGVSTPFSFILGIFLCCICGVTTTERERDDIQLG